MGRSKIGHEVWGFDIHVFCGSIRHKQIVTVSVGCLGVVCSHCPGNVTRLREVYRGTVGTLSKVRTDALPRTESSHRGCLSVSLRKFGPQERSNRRGSLYVTL